MNIRNCRGRACITPVARSLGRLTHGVPSVLGYSRPFWSRRATRARCGKQIRRHQKSRASFNTTREMPPLVEVSGISCAAMCGVGKVCRPHPSQPQCASRNIAPSLRSANSNGTIPWSVSSGGTMGARCCASTGAPPPSSAGRLAGADVHHEVDPALRGERVGRFVSGPAKGRSEYLSGVVGNLTGRGGLTLRAARTCIKRRFRPFACTRLAATPGLGTREACAGRGA